MRRMLKVAAFSLETMMSMDTPVVLGPEHPWKRLLAMVAFGAVGYMLVPLILLLAVAQFGFHLWSGSSNTRLAHLGDTIRAFLWAILDFLLYRTDLLPYPFNPIPSDSMVANTVPQGNVSGPQPATDRSAVNWRACLLHLGSCQAGERTDWSVAQAIRTDDEQALIALGIRPWAHEGEAHLAFATRNSALSTFFVGTPWHGRAWAAALKEAPGATSRRIRILPDSNPRHTVLVPLRLVLAAFDT